MQVIPIIVVGALGRMGSTITRLAREDAQLRLAALVECPGRAAELCSIDGCLTGGDLDLVLATIKGGVAVEFSSPEVSLQNAAIAARHGVPHVIGATGLTDAQKAELAELAKIVPIFWAPNMSVGVNALTQILPELARLLGDEYDMEIVEVHHNRKKDAPSGTALRLGEVLAEARGWGLQESAVYCREGIIGERPHKEIGVQTLRGGDVAGIHTVYFFGSGERVEVTHHAHSRDNFAKGALRAAKWLSAQKPSRLYSMQDML